MVSLKDVRTQALNYLHSIGHEEASADLSLILMHLLNIDKTQLVLGTRIISDDECTKIHSSIKRLAGGEPVSYIIGCCEFMSLKFVTRSGVLIPRADTEVLVEAVMSRLDSNHELRIADICCGSGCIGISLAHYMPGSVITAYDISNDAVSLTAENAKLHDLSDRVSVIREDVLSSISGGQYHCVVSNPPYIQTGVIQTLAPKVRRFEPLKALDGGDDGLIFYRKISAAAPLIHDGLLAFEIGYDQGESVCSILKESGYSDIEIIKDIENRDRVIIGRYA